MSLAGKEAAINVHGRHIKLGSNPPQGAYNSMPIEPNVLLWCFTLLIYELINACLCLQQLYQLWLVVKSSTMSFLGKQAAH